MQSNKLEFYLKHLNIKQYFNFKGDKGIVVKFEAVTDSGTSSILGRRVLFFVGHLQISEAYSSLLFEA